MMMHFSMCSSVWKPCHLGERHSSQHPRGFPVTCTNAEAKRRSGTASTSGRSDPPPRPADSRSSSQDDEEPAKLANQPPAWADEPVRMPSRKQAALDGNTQQRHAMLKPEVGRQHPGKQQAGLAPRPGPGSLPQRSPQPHQLASQQPRKQDSAQRSGAHQPQQRQPGEPGQQRRRPRQQQQLAAAPRPPPSPTFRAADKAYLKPEQRAELARRLRRADPAAAAGAAAASRPPLRIFRHAIDDLRLFSALEAAGLAGRVVVADSLQGADAVLATRHKRTGRDVSLVQARRAAGNAGLPFLELQAVSPLRVAQALAPLMGLDVPAHLLRPRRAAGAGQLPRLPSPPPPAAGPAVGTEAQQAVAQNPTPLLTTPDPAGPRSRVGGDAPSDLLDAVDAREDRRGQLPSNKYDVQGTRHALRRQGAPNGRARRRELMREMQEDRAPW